MPDQENEQELRERVRRSLENIVGDSLDAEATPPSSQAEIGRLQAILDEETEAFYGRMGLVKHVSRSGRTHWVTPQEKERLEARRRRSRRRKPLQERVDRRVLFVWIVTGLVAAVLLVYLLKTEVIG